MDNCEVNSVCAYLRTTSLTVQPVQSIDRMQINGQRHSSDMESSLMLMAEKRTEDYDPILYLKKQGEKDEKFGLSEDDFYVVIQTENQRKLMKKYGQRGFCVDSTTSIWALTTRKECP